MGFLRRRHRAKQEPPVYEEITITLDPLTSSSLRMQAAMERHGEQHPETIEAMRQVAYCLSATPQRQQEAAELLQHVAGLTYLSLGPDHPDTLTSMHEAGDSLFSVGNLEPAEEMLRDTLARRDRVLGRDHPDTLATAQALGSVLTSLGRPAEAQALHEDVSERRAAVSGAGRKDTITSRGMTADALRTAGRLEDAAALFRELVHDAEHEFGVNSQEATSHRNNLAATEFQLGNAETAAQMFREVLATVAHDPDQQRLTASVRNNLATVLFGLEEYHEAGELLRDSLAECERMFGPDHPDTIRSLANLAQVLAVDGKRTEAAQLTRRCLSHYATRLPASHPRIAELRSFLDELS